MANFYQLFSIPGAVALGSPGDLLYSSIVKIRRVLLILLAGVFIVGFLIWPSDREPRYEGKTLSEWLMLPERATTQEERNQLEARSSNALRHIGTNAIPYLLTWMKYESPAWRNKVDKVMDKLPDRITDTPPMKSISSDRKSDRAEAAPAGFYYLGPVASAAIPELNRLMLATNSAECSRRAATSLSYIGADALPFLVAAIQSRQYPRAIGFLRFMQAKGADMRPAVPVLLDCLNDPDVSLAASAARSLIALKTEPDQVVPALIRATGKDRHVDIRRSALSALPRFGEAARPAIPVVMEYLSDPNPDVARSAVVCLGRLKLDLDLTLPVIVRAMRERNDYYFSGDALVVLRDVGDEARPIIPDILQIMRDPELNAAARSNVPTQDLLNLTSNVVFSIAPDVLGYSNRVAEPSVAGERYGGVKPP